ncbi:MAG: hypothetical protein HYV07_24300 [Deltaproteobacteria bacterium]|nr:hypothetical protein [Deltaproteobacteria bacterium]
MSAQRVYRIAIVLAVLVAFWDVVPGARGLLLEGHEIQRKTWREIAEAFRAFEVPVVARPSFSSVPLEQRVLAAYTPITLWFFLLPFNEAYDAYVITHYVLLGLGAFSLASSFRARPEEAFVAAIVTALSGPALSLDVELATLTALAWLPLALLTFRLLARNPGLRTAGVFGLCLGFHLQGISWTILAVDAAAFPSVILGARSLGERRAPGTLRFTVLGTALASAIATISLGPALLASFESELPRRLARQTIGLSIYQLAELLAPALFAPPDLPFAEVRALSEHQRLDTVWTPTSFKSYYLGASLALLALVTSSRRTRAIGAAVGLAFGLALAGGTPVFGQVKDLGPLAHGVDAAHLSLFVSLALAAFAPVALRIAPEKPWLLVLGAFVHLVCATATSRTVLSDEFKNFLALSFGPQAVPVRTLALAPNELPLGPAFGEAFDRLPDLAMGAMGARLAHGTTFALGMLVVALVMAGWKKLDVGRQSLSLLIALDLVVGARFTIFGVDLDSARPPAEVLAAIAHRDQRVLALRPRAFEPKRNAGAGRTFAEAEAISRGRRGELDGATKLRTYDPRVAGLDGAAWASRMAGLVHATTGLRIYGLLERAGVAHFTTWFQSIEGPARLVSLIDVPNEPPELIFALDATPKLVSAHDHWLRVDPLETETEVAGRFFALDPRGALLLTPGASPHLVPPRCDGAPLVAAKLISSGPMELRVESSGTCQALIVARELHAPRWRAALDGKPVHVEMTELGWLGAIVPSGAHAIDFRYDPVAPKAFTPFLAGVLLAIALALGPQRPRA